MTKSERSIADHSSHVPIKTHSSCIFTHDFDDLISIYSHQELQTRQTLRVIHVPTVRWRVTRHFLFHIRNQDDRQATAEVDQRRGASAPRFQPKCYNQVKCFVLRQCLDRICRATLWVNVRDRRNRGTYWCLSPSPSQFPLFENENNLFDSQFRIHFVKEIHGRYWRYLILLSIALD